MSRRPRPRPSVGLLRRATGLSSRPSPLGRRVIRRGRTVFLKLSQEMWLRLPLVVIAFIALCGGFHAPACATLHPASARVSCHPRASYLGKIATGFRAGFATGTAATARMDMSGTTGGARAQIMKTLVDQIIHPTGDAASQWAVRIVQDKEAAEPKAVPAVRIKQPSSEPSFYSARELLPEVASPRPRVTYKVSTAPVNMNTMSPPSVPKPSATSRAPLRPAHSRVSLPQKKKAAPPPMSVSTSVPPPPELNVPTARPLAWRLPEPEVERGRKAWAEAALANVRAAKEAAARTAAERAAVQRAKAKEDMAKAEAVWAAKMAAFKEKAKAAEQEEALRAQAEMAVVRAQAENEEAALKRKLANVNIEEAAAQVKQFLAVQMTEEEQAKKRWLARIDADRQEQARAMERARSAAAAGMSNPTTGPSTASAAAELASERPESTWLKHLRMCQCTAQPFGLAECAAAPTSAPPHATESAPDSTWLQDLRRLQHEAEALQHEAEAKYFGEPPPGFVWGPLY